MQNYDDKDLVIVAVFLLCFAAVVVSSAVGPIPQAVAELLKNAFAGLFGVAIGRASNGT